MLVFVHSGAAKYLASVAGASLGTQPTALNHQQGITFVKVDSPPDDGDGTYDVWLTATSSKKSKLLAKPSSIAGVHVIKEGGKFMKFQLQQYLADGDSSHDPKSYVGTSSNDPSKPKPTVVGDTIIKHVIVLVPEGDIDEDTAPVAALSKGVTSKDDTTSGLDKFKQDPDTSYRAAAVPVSFPVLEGTHPVQGMLNEETYGAMSQVSPRLEKWVELAKLYDQSTHNFFENNKNDLKRLDLYPEVKKGQYLIGNDESPFVKLEAVDDELALLFEVPLTNLLTSLDDIAENNVKKAAATAAMKQPIPKSIKVNAEIDGSLSVGGLTKDISHDQALLAKFMLPYIGFNGKKHGAMPFGPTLKEDTTAMFQSPTKARAMLFNQIMIEGEMTLTTSSLDFADRLVQFPEFSRAKAVSRYTHIILVQILC